MNLTTYLDRRHFGMVNGYNYQNLTSFVEKFIITDKENQEWCLTTNIHPYTLIPMILVLDKKKLTLDYWNLPYLIENILKLNKMDGGDNPATLAQTIYLAKHLYKSKDGGVTGIMMSLIRKIRQSKNDLFVYSFKPVLNEIERGFYRVTDNRYDSEFVIDFNDDIFRKENINISVLIQGNKIFDKDDLSANHKKVNIKSNPTKGNFEIVIEDRRLIISNKPMNKTNAIYPTRTYNDAKEVYFNVFPDNTVAIEKHVKAISRIIERLVSNPNNDEEVYFEIDKNIKRNKPLTTWFG